MNDKEYSKYEYAVVEFTDEKGQIAIIPYVWITNETPEESWCYWPPIRSTTKFNKAIMSKIEPDCDWEIHSIKIFRKSPAVCQVPNTMGVSQASIEDVIKCWLRSSIDREGVMMNITSKFEKPNGLNNENELFAVTI